MDENENVEELIEDSYGIVNMTRLDGELTNIADAIRAKLPFFDYELTLDITPDDLDPEPDPIGPGVIKRSINNTFVEAIHEFPIPDYGFQPTGWTKYGTPHAGIMWNTNGVPDDYFNSEYFVDLSQVRFYPAPENGYIGDGAFMNCESLSHIDLSGITYIGRNAFLGTSLIDDLVFNADMKGVDSTSFAGCTLVDNIYCCWAEGEKPEIEQNAPWGCTNAVIHYNDPNLLMFYSEDPFSFYIDGHNNNGNWNGTLEYSYNRTTWYTVPKYLPSTLAISSGSHIIYNNVIYLRGTNNTRISNSSLINNIASFHFNGNNIHCEGNIEGLLDYEMVRKGDHPTMDAKCFNGLFFGNSALITAPKLGAVILTAYCYANMFQDCTSLIKSPEILATTLAANCCDSMFRGCTSLVIPPELLATTAQANCYFWMFNGCTSLIKPPALPATTLGSSCYSGMFMYCTSLSGAPILPAMTLTANCYENMFFECTSLVVPPSLPATTLAQSCYYCMFGNCTNLQRLPELPTTYLYNSCYASMFIGCSLINIQTTSDENFRYEFRIPKEGDGTGQSNDNHSRTGPLRGMFSGTANPISVYRNTTYYTNQPLVSCEVEHTK